MRRSFSLIFMLLISTLTWAQQGSIVGTVKDKQTNEGAIGATVGVTGTTQAVPVDVEGNYELKLPVGTYNITITSVGYKPMNVPGVVVKKDEKTRLDGALESTMTALQDVVVTGQRQTGTDIALIQDIRKSEVVVSGMSSDQIVKTMDRDAAEVVKRIPGVTIQSNNFVVIRGLAERYNTVLLNDALTPSAEVDTRSFSFDVLPSSVIDRILIFKSGSPELPGEFGGGVVKVYTKNSVLENTTSLSVSGWHRSGTTFSNDYMRSRRGGTDWLGFDSGQRALNDAVPNGVVKPGLSTAAELNSTANALRSTTWLPSIGKALPDLRASLGLTRRFEIGQAYISNVTSISYSNTREQYAIERNRYTKDVDPTTGYRVPQYEFDDERALTAVRLGAVHNWQVRLNNRNRLEWRNFFNQYGTDEVIHRTGMEEDKQRDDYALHYQSRTIYSGQLQGTHDLGENEHTTVTWATGYNYVFRDEPDYSRYRYQKQILPGIERPYFVNVPNEGNITETGRFFSNLHENTVMGSGQWERRFAGRDTTSASQFKLRAGFYTEHKQRDYQQRYFSYVRAPRFDKFDTQLLPIEQIFAPENLDPVTGYTVDEGTKPVDSYTAENSLLAGYIGVVAPLSDKLNLSGGIRVEHNRRQLRNVNGVQYEENRTIPMPSLNATYNLSPRALVRLGGSVTVNRPEFRETAPRDLVYYDVASNAVISGNPNLRTATIYNSDLRYEFYPSRSEMVSAGLFFKTFRDAIEQTTVNQTGSMLGISYQNAERAYNAGAEIEVRKSLVGLTENTFLQRLSLVLNASVIYSRVDLPQDSSNLGFSLTNRPLQGQSPYVVNAGVFYQDDDHGWQVSAQYNVIGQRFSFIGDHTQNFSVIEMPRNVIDLAVTKNVGQHLQLKAGVQDLLNQPIRQYYDFNYNSKIDPGEQAPFARYRRGRYTMLGLVYKF